MNVYLNISFVYFLAAVCTAVLLGTPLEIAFLEIVSAVLRQVNVVSNWIFPFIALVAFVVWRSSWGGIHARRAQILQAFLGFVLMLAGFITFKTHLPLIALSFADPPFFADPMLAEFDKWLHGGVDPYIIAHKYFAHLGTGWVDWIYGGGWGFIVTTMMLFVAISDDDQDRIRDVVYLYLFTHMVLGNLLAFAFMSAGPVYYDQIFETDRFSGLASALQSIDMINSFIGRIQAVLLSIYQQGAFAFGSGISAFPSVHVAVSMVAALYFCSRSRWFLPFSIFFVAAIQLQSVYTGYHYAIDGYFSIIVVTLLWWWLRRRRRPVTVAV